MFGKEESLKEEALLSGASMFDFKVKSVKTSGSRLMESVGAD